MMKGLSYSFLRAVCALILGLILVVFPDKAGDYLVITIGVVFLVPSLISLIAYFVKGVKGIGRFPIEAVGSLLFGLWLVVMPTFFADLLTYVLGFILAMGGVQQIASLMAARRWASVPAGFYVVPVLILLAGLLAVFNPIGARSAVFILIGVGCMIYAVMELVNWFRFIRHRPSTSGVSLKSKMNDVEDAEVID